MHIDMHIDMRAIGRSHTSVCISRALRGRGGRRGNSKRGTCLISGKGGYGFKTLIKSGSAIAHRHVECCKSSSAPAGGGFTV